MKKILLALFLILVKSSYCQTANQKFVATDIDNFWMAYDKIISTNDSIAQSRYLNEFYLEKASPGLKSLIEVRNYTPKEFLTAITKYPKFWNSLKANTTNFTSIYSEIETDISKLKEAYPELKPSTIYFLIGAFRTNGTTQNDRILIGSEMSLADENTFIDEFPEGRKAFYKEYNPRKNLSLLCTHEYIHTQQNELVENLLSMCLYEGVAEFVSCKVTGKKSNSPAIEFGKNNEKKVVSQFVSDLYIMSNNYSWLWGENRNDLKVRDLGYYIGYEICERYYNASKNKSEAIKKLIELDYTNEKEIEKIVNASGLLPKSLQNLYKDYENQRPTVVAITPFKNGNKKVKSGSTAFTITFSEPLNGHNTGIDFGPLGEDACPKIETERIWSSDKKSWTFKADLKPNKKYQILITNNFRKVNGVRLKPYLIEFQTAE